MNTADYDYELPESHIARYPPTTRGTTRLLTLSRSSGAIGHAHYAELDQFLEPGDLLVLNTTRVVRARLFAVKPTGAKIELVLLEKHQGEQQLALYRGRLRPGDQLLVEGRELRVEEIVDQGIARLSVPGGGTVAELFASLAEVPIPPYLKREAEAVDRERYQTVFAEHPGSVAAPTASLNMTPELLGRLARKGIGTASLTLHVGLGTFLPIRSDSLEEHVMHREYYRIPAATIEAISQAKRNGGRIVAVGTTVTRALEHAGERLHSHAGSEPVAGEADIFIYPGYRFRTIDMLLTNFHAPRSTVLMLTAALAGSENLRRAYREALDEGYRFLSYGDSMLIG